MNKPFKVRSKAVSTAIVASFDYHTLRILEDLFIKHECLDRKEDFRPDLSGSTKMVRLYNNAYDHCGVITEGMILVFCDGDFEAYSSIDKLKKSMEIIEQEEK